MAFWFLVGVTAVVVFGPLIGGTVPMARCLLRRPG
jgi:hypothetical protein